MLFIYTILAFLLRSEAVLVTEYVDVTAYAYQDIDIIVDGQGNPVTTIVTVVSTAASYENPVEPTISQTPTTSIAVALSSYAESTSASSTISDTVLPQTTSQVLSHSHLATTLNDYQYITPAASADSSAVALSSEAPASEPPVVRQTSSDSPSLSSASPVSTSTYTPSAEAPASTTTSASSGGSGAEFSGDATYYAPGLGACGWTNTESDFIAALNVDQFNGFGSMSNGNPVCGKKATIQYQGKTVTVTITDKCPGCSHGDLDLSPAAFQQLADESLGRIHIDWSFDN